VIKYITSFYFYNTVFEDQPSNQVTRRETFVTNLLLWDNL